MADLFLLVGLGLFTRGIYMLANSHGRSGNFVMSEMVLAAGLVSGLIGLLELRRQLRR